MYQRPKSTDCLVISVGRSGISLSLMKTPNSQGPTPKPRAEDTLGVGNWKLEVVDVPSGAREHVGDVVLPFYVVARRKISSVMAAAALLPAQRGARDHQTDGHDAAHAAELGVAAAIRRRRADQRVPRLETRERLLDQASFT